ncbi:RNA 3'-phosphate cyclase [Candidatus Woesearchaeota archaeon]|jgi:RNA 3'-phosphate cyclase|nr:RNA 3'-phosphate cyclase [Candidatus Woesearchaeota archaeon]
MIKLDGSHGEGGGAILRQALALSTLTGKPFEIKNIRKGRPTPGLKAQHLHSINALKELSGCTITDYEVGTERLTFTPGIIKNKSISIDVGTAGSITLLLQSLMLPCMLSGKRITIKLVGGTDVKWSQPIDYFANVLVPIFRTYANIQVLTVKRGYYPKGAGEVIVKIKSHKFHSLERIDFTKKKKLLRIRGVSHSSSNLKDVADRQARTAKVLLSNLGVEINIARQYSNTSSTGSGITLWALYNKNDSEFSQPVILGGDSLGEKGKKAEDVGMEATENLKKEMNSDACVDKYLADQIIPLLGVTKGKIKTSHITKHTYSNIYVTKKFLKTKFKITKNLIEVE